MSCKYAYNGSQLKLTISIFCILLQSSLFPVFGANDTGKPNFVLIVGQWECKLEPNNRGQSENWQDRDIKSLTVTLPGTTQSNEIGPVPSKKVISSLTPTTEYIGAAWYQREIELSKADCQRHIDLFLERCGWVSAVWLNGTALGTQDTLVSPHVYDLSAAAKPGCQVTEFELTFGKDMRLWDEFDPYLYRLVAQLENSQASDIQSTEFGMRNLSQVGTQLAIKGRATFLAGR